MSLIERINAFFAKLPFKSMAEKIPAETRAKVPILNKVIPFANQIVCGLVLVLLVTVIASSGGGGESVGDASGGGGSGKFGTKESPASDFVYELNEARDGIVITGYKGRGGDIVIPSTIEGYPVVEFAANALSGFRESTIRWELNRAYKFLKNTKNKDEINMYKEEINNLKDQIKKANIRPSITSVVFPDSITEMAPDAGFMGRNKSDGAFEASFALKAFKFPKNIKVIPALFNACDALTTIVLPENPEIIVYRAFHGLNITSIVIPEGVKEIRNGAFEECKELTSVKIPDSIEIIGNYAFYKCSALTKVDIPAKKIKYGSFEDEYFDGDYGKWFFGGVVDAHRVFGNCINLPLAERKKIEDTGYTGTFVDP
jgi:hypothetical protein